MTIQDYYKEGLASKKKLSVYDNAENAIYKISDMLRAFEEFSDKNEIKFDREIIFSIMQELKNIYYSVAEQRHSQDTTTAFFYISSKISKEMYDKMED